MVIHQSMHMTSAMRVIGMLFAKKWWKMTQHVQHKQSPSCAWWSTDLNVNCFYWDNFLVKEWFFKSLKLKVLSEVLSCSLSSSLKYYKCVLDESHTIMGWKLENKRPKQIKSLQTQRQQSAIFWPRGFMPELLPAFKDLRQWKYHREPGWFLFLK